MCVNILHGGTPGLPLQHTPKGMGVCGSALPGTTTRLSHPCCCICCPAGIAAHSCNRVRAK